MNENYCPRCETAGFEKRAHSICTNCNFDNTRDSETEGSIIPRWVLNHLKLSTSEINDIAEINSGMYGPGYKGVVKPPEDFEHQWTPPPTLRRLKWSRKPKNKVSFNQLPLQVAVNF